LPSSPPCSAPRRSSTTLSPPRRPSRRPQPLGTFLAIPACLLDMIVSISGPLGWAGEPIRLRYRPLILCGNLKSAPPVMFLNCSWKHLSIDKMLTHCLPGVFGCDCVSSR
jgi:hypothetical protein